MTDRNRSPRRDRNPETLRATFDRCATRGETATRAGRFDDALRWYRRSRVVARALGDRSRSDAADLNVAMVHVQAGEARLGEDGLREILLRTADDRVAFSAAYNLASSLRRQSRHDKAMGYAVRAVDRARKLDAVDLAASAEMLVGNILLSQSYPDRALDHYRRSLDMRRDSGCDDRYSRAILLENLGYCLLQLRRLDEGLTTIASALEIAEDVGDDRCRAECHQDLCYGRLLRDELEEAATHGRRALALARERGYADIEENCHYLLGELCARRGDTAGRDEHFQQLQRLHPELPFLKDFLCAVDVTSIITLKR